VYQHHEESIGNAIEYFRKDPEVEGLLLGGSIAHGFAVPASDIDVMILVSDERYAERLDQGRLCSYNKELCTYADGYVDGKYLGVGRLQQVAERGSEPARFAFQDARVLFSRGRAFDRELQAIVRYPVEGKAERMRRFNAQLEAWYWYTTEALRLGNRYLLGLAVSKLVLFGGRLILTHNELLYPYHKWFLQVLEGAREKPPDLLGSIESLYQDTSAENVRHFYESVKEFRDWGMLATGWPVQFMLDSELNWQNGATPIDDV
jgi:predicted nucleotidyltransferase